MAGSNYYGFTPGGTHFSTGIGSSSGSNSYASSPSVYGNSQSTYGSGGGGRPQSGYQDAQYGAYAGRTQSVSSPSATYVDMDFYFTSPLGALSSNSDSRTVGQYRYQSAAPDERSSYSIPAAPNPSRAYAAGAGAATTGSGAGIQSTYNGSRLSQYDWQSTIGGAGKVNSVERNLSDASPVGPKIASQRTGQTMPAAYNTNVSFNHKKIAVDNSSRGGSFWHKKQFSYGAQRQAPNQTPKESQLHYCEICRISCAGSQTYSEHLEGKNHKKKEAMVGATASSRGSRQFRCELCDIACTCADTYAAHIRGVKHQKVLNLHQKLGKPIPDLIKLEDIQSSAAATGAGSRSTDGVQMEESVVDVAVEEAVSATDTGVSDDVQPVGLEYIEEGCNDAGTAASFFCKLCNCNFTDPQAKYMHSKGRRHRQNYKDKVDPSLVVDVKAAKINPYSRRTQMDRFKRQIAPGGDLWHKRRPEDAYRLEVEELRYEQEVLRWQLTQATSGVSIGGVRPPQIDCSGDNGRLCSDPENDRYVTSKHNSVYPTKEDLDAVQAMVSACERALKLVSDQLAIKTTIAETVSSELKTSATETETQESDSAAEDSSRKLSDTTPLPELRRQLKGVMRVGLLAKGLLLHDDLDLQLVVLCHERPTTTLLHSIYDSLPKQFATFSDEQYAIQLSETGDGIVVKRDEQPRVTCTISLTSPVVKDEPTDADTADYLNRHSCLLMLAALRHTKWFQATVGRMPTGLVLIRVLRDLCQRVPTWQPIGQWTLELLVEKCLSTASNSLSPALGLRRIFECIASGMFLTGSPGIIDPCEKEPCDMLSFLTAQQREDITLSAQHALRWMAFGRLYRVLGIEQLPSPTIPPGQRKRPLADSTTV